MGQQDAAEYFEKILRLASPEASEVFLVRTTRCTSCQCKNSSDEPSLLWTIYLLNNNDSIHYNVQKGLEGYFSESKSTGDNQMYCFNCKARSDSITKWTIQTYPKVLVLLLKRYVFSLDKMDYVKNNHPVAVPLNVELPKLPKVQGAQGVSYELYATVDHVGNLGAGHYTATIQSPDGGGCWYDFNDSRVTPKKNFNPIKNQSGYLLFYRKTQMSDSPQEHPHGSSVDPAESEPNQNNADNGNADHDSDDSSHAPPSPSGPLDGQPRGAGSVDVTGGDEVTKGVVLAECGDVTRADDGTVGVDGTKYGEVAEVGSREPGDHSVPQEASGTAPIVSSPEVFVNKEWGGQRESTDLLEDLGEGETEGDVIQKTENDNTDDGNADHDSVSEANPTPPSSSGPMDKRPVSAWRDDDTEEVDVKECGDGIGVDEVKEKDDAMACDVVRAVDEVVAGEPQPMEVEGLDGKAGESMTTDVKVPTNEKESRKPGDQAVQQEASGTSPMVSGPEGGVNERRRGQRESTLL